MALERTCLDLIDVDEHINLYCNLAFSNPVYKNQHWTKETGENGKSNTKDFDMKLMQCDALV